MEYSLLGKKNRLTPLQTQLKCACIIYQIVNVSDDVKTREKKKKKSTAFPSSDNSIYFRYIF